MIGLIVAAAATAGSDHLELNPLVTWLLRLARDTALLRAGVLLISLGIRSVRRSGPSLRNLLYPIGGVVLFVSLIAAAIAADRAVARSIEVLGESAPLDLVSSRNSLSRAALAWFAAGIGAGPAGFLMPLTALPAAQHAAEAAGREP